MVPCFVVRRYPHPEGRAGEFEVVSAWTDIYAAKHEATRWEQDTKVPHDYVEGVIVLTSNRPLS